LTEGLRATVSDGVGTVALDRPDKRNAVTQAMWGGLPDAVRRLDADPGVRLVVLRGTGDHFAGGADIAEFAHVYATRADARSYAATMAGAMDAVAACGTPVLAAIRGVCIGGGVALALRCDLRVADATASFAVPPARLGIAYAFEDTLALVRAIGAPAARDLLFTARRIDAQAARSLGLVDRLCEDGALDREIAGYAELLRRASPASIRVAKSFVALCQAGQRAEDGSTRDACLDLLDGPDFVEGYSAFMEKRSPRFG
jgi:enoyl-CoA hydratase/carnithine racemase